MRLSTWCGALALCVAASSLAGQTALSAVALPQLALPAGSSLPMASQLQPAFAPGSHAVLALQSFRETDVKFQLRDLMEILRDRRHEGWVLAAYPDPKTGQPLIGAGVSLDLPAREHPQTDPMNPHDFIEPSSAELWQAAGLEPQRLDTILAEFDRRLAAWSKKGFRRKINTLTPEITDDGANQLLRVSAIQAIYNARGYCRGFDRLTASQQMALSQLVYQMGVNLAEFSQFLELINSYAERDGTIAAPVDATAAPMARAAYTGDADYWKAVQQSLVESQWARAYRMRAVSVIAMLDPRYVSEPRIAEQRVGAMLRPAVVRRRSGHAATLRSVSARKAGPSHGSSIGAKSKRLRKRGV